jgi:hypothetical protein
MIVLSTLIQPNLLLPDNTDSKKARPKKSVWTARRPDDRDGKKDDQQQENGPDAKRFEWGISSIFTVRSNAAAALKGTQDGAILFFRGPCLSQGLYSGLKSV